MKIYICCSKVFYGTIPSIQNELEQAGHSITLPNSFDHPTKELEMKELGAKEHSNWKAEMLRLQVQKVARNDVLLILNFEKNKQANYIGGATFLEMYEAFRLHKPIFLYNDIPEGMLHDEILAFAPTVIQHNLSLIE